MSRIKATIWNYFKYQTIMKGTYICIIFVTFVAIIMMNPLK